MGWRRTIAASSLPVLLIPLAAVGCAGAAEEPIVRQFFTASRLRDRATLGSFAAVRFDPATDGTVSSFSITNVGEEQSAPLGLKALAEQHDAALAEEAEFTERKVAYQNENIDAIGRVLKSEREGTKLSRQDAEVQAAWTKFREETAQFSKRVSDAKLKLTSESGIAEVSVSEPGREVDVTQYDGEMITKELTIEASVRMPDGNAVDKTLVMTLQRAVLKGDPAITGKWIITGLRDASASPAGNAP